LKDLLVPERNAASRRRALVKRSDETRIGGGTSPGEKNIGGDPSAARARRAVRRQSLIEQRKSSRMMVAKAVSAPQPGGLVEDTFDLIRMEPAGKKARTPVEKHSTRNLNAARKRREEKSQSVAERRSLAQREKPDLFTGPRSAHDDSSGAPTDLERKAAVLRTEPLPLAGPLPEQDEKALRKFIGKFTYVLSDGGVKVVTPLAMVVDKLNANADAHDPISGPTLATYAQRATADAGQVPKITNPEAFLVFSQDRQAEILELRKGNPHWNPNSAEASNVLGIFTSTSQIFPQAKMHLDNFLGDIGEAASSGDYRPLQHRAREVLEKVGNVANRLADSAETLRRPELLGFMSRKDFAFCQKYAGALDDLARHFLGSSEVKGLLQLAGLILTHPAEVVQLVTDQIFVGTAQARLRSGNSPAGAGAVAAKGEKEKKKV
jgi:hypothetical protein